jgi:hypothetical protein
MRANSEVVEHFQHQDMREAAGAAAAEREAEPATRFPGIAAAEQAACEAEFEKVASIHGRLTVYRVAGFVSTAGQQKFYDLLNLVTALRCLIIERALAVHSKI